jgi:hypothetical protein
MITPTRGAVCDGGESLAIDGSAGWGMRQLPAEGAEIMEATV